jgi:hypothetical protein
MAAWPLAAGAQPGKARTILWVSTEAQPDPFIEGFREGMREHGYSEGQNLAFSLRYAPGNPGGLRAMLPELLALPADLIVSSGPAIVATRAVTAKPVLFAISSDPVALGIAESLARPGLQYASLGMQALANDHTVLERDGGSLVLAGVTDLSAPRSSHPAPDLSAALEGAPSRTPIILLDHQPRNAPQAAARGVALQLSGHTHGGMIPGLDRLVARQQRLRLGSIPGRRHDALRQQRHGVVARLRLEARALVRTDAHHPATRVTAGWFTRLCADEFGADACSGHRRLNSR